MKMVEGPYIWLQHLRAKARGVAAEMASTKGEMVATNVQAMQMENGLGSNDTLVDNKGCLHRSSATLSAPPPYRTHLLIVITGLDEEMRGPRRKKRRVMMIDFLPCFSYWLTITTIQGWQSLLATGREREPPRTTREKFGREREREMGYICVALVGPNQSNSTRDWGGVG